jgi:MCP family monocarboxylic acid transporter-like MFS transporter 10
MLNNLFNGSVGYHNGVRISTGMNAGLLIFAILVMRTRLPPKKTGSTMPPVKEFLKDTPYVLLVARSLHIPPHLNRADLTLPCSSFLQTIGIFFPIFFLQLYAVSHGVDEQFALYCVRLCSTSEGMISYIDVNRSP